MTTAAEQKQEQQQEEVVEEVTGYSEAELAGLSPEERDALKNELDDNKPSQFIDESEVEATQAKAAADKEAADAASKEAADKAAADKATADAAAAEAAKAGEKKEETPAAQTVTVNEPEPVVALVRTGERISDEAHAQALAALAERHENDEITTAQMMIEVDRLSRAKATSDLATMQAAGAEEATWERQQSAFYATAGNEVIRDNPLVHAAMQAALSNLYADKSKNGLSNIQYLVEAGNEVRKLMPHLFGATPAVEKKEEPKKTAPKELSGVQLPNTLASVPAAEQNVSNDEFSHIDKLNGMEYEMAFSRLSPEQRARFLAV